MSSDSLSHDDRSARAGALDVTRSFIVQAPAGSGKTELLIQRYLTLLATVDHPEEILAITFTRKAAQEMQLRVIGALQQAQSGDRPAAAHHAITFDAAHRVLERDQKLNWLLIDAPRRMRILTLDALNSSLARSLPFSSGLGGAAKVVSGEEMQSLYRVAAAATLEWLLSDDDINKAVEQVLVHLDNSVSTYIGHLATMLASRDQWLPIVGAGLGNSDRDDTVRKMLEQNVADRITAHLQRLQSVLPAEFEEPLLTLGRYAAGHIIAAGNTDHPLAALERCIEWPLADATCMDQWRGLAGLLLTLSGGWRKSVNRTNGFPTGDQGQKQRMQELLRSLAGYPEVCSVLHELRHLPNPRYTDEQWSVLLALFRLLPLAVTELRQLFDEKGVTDHTEVALAADAALGSVDEPGDVALLLDYRLRHLLIDEMQDTSIAQYRLIEKLIAGWQPGDGRTLVCVGDPMQSIYRFRNAEVGQFLLARKAGIAAVHPEPLLLRQNFRSGERLVHWFNTVFEQTLPSADDIAAGAIAYSASVPVAAHRDRGECQVHPLFGASAEDEAAYGVKVIQRCLETPAAETTAVLVRSRTRLPLLLAELRAAKIDYQAIEIDRLTDLPEIIDILALTRALCHRSDRIAWLGVLRGPWVGLSWSDLHKLARNDRQSTLWELLQDPDRVAGLSAEAAARIKSFREKITACVAGHGAASLREIVEQAWYALGGPLLADSEEQVENIYRFLDVLERIEMAGTLPDVAELETRLDQERVSSRGDHDGRLQIMTMHKAKGLEFDHVVLYGLGRRPQSTRKSVLNWLTLPGSDGSKDLLVSPIGPRAELEHDCLHNYITTIERKKERLEQDRLLYVACTRARRSLHLLGHVALKPDGDDFNDPPDSSLLSGIWPTVQSIYAEAFKSRDTTDTASRQTGNDSPFRSPELYRFRDRQQLPPAPELPGVDEPLDAAIASEGQQVDYYWVGSIARHAGTIVHRWLKRITDGRLQVDPGTIGRLLPVSRNWARELGVPVSDIDAVCDRVVQALVRTLDDEQGRWVLSGEGFAELPVTGLWNDNIESIVIDRIRVDGDGVHWIVDYKTSAHEGAGLDRFLLQEADRYRAQLSKYALLYGQLVDAPVRTALYFPLLGQFREVAVDA